MSDATSIVKRYIDSWNETDPVRRRKLIEELYTQDVVYTDPMAQATGWNGIDSTISAVQSMFPQHVFRLGGPVDAHHETIRFQWHLATQEAKEPLVIGFDVAALEGGRIRQVFGFLDKVPQAS